MTLNDSTKSQRTGTRSALGGKLCSLRVSYGSEELRRIVVTKKSDTYQQSSS